MTHLFMENYVPESWSSAHIYQSQWLQTTLSDLDEKLEAMMTILEGTTSSNQEHVDRKWREELVQMLEEFGQSYRVLAIAYSQLKSKTSHDSGYLSSSSTTNTKSVICHKRTSNQGDKKHKEGCNSHPKSLAEFLDIKFHGKLNLEHLNKQEDEYSDPCRLTFQPELGCRDNQMEDRKRELSTDENAFMEIECLELNQRIEVPFMINSKFDNTWSMLKYQITKLTQDNLHQLVELVQRNDEKRETIKRLQLEVETLKRENKGLQISLRHSNADSECYQPQISRQGRLSMGKLFRGCSP